MTENAPLYSCSCWCSRTRNPQRGKCSPINGKSQRKNLWDF